jgi:hypothetical protein
MLSRLAESDMRRGGSAAPLLPSGQLGRRCRERYRRNDEWHRSAACVATVCDSYRHLRSSVDRRHPLTPKGGARLSESRVAPLRLLLNCRTGALVRQKLRCASEIGWPERNTGKTSHKRDASRIHHSAYQGAQDSSMEILIGTNQSICGCRRPFWFGGHAAILFRLLALRLNLDAAC